MKAWFKKHLKLVSNERAVLVGVALSGASIAAEFTVDGKIDWRSATPAFVGLIIRQFVYGPRAVEEAHERVAKLEAILEDISRRVIEKKAVQPKPEEGDGAA